MNKRSRLLALAAAVLLTACTSAQPPQEAVSAAPVSSVPTKQNGSAAEEVASLAEQDEVQPVDESISVTAEETITVTGSIMQNSGDAFPVYGLKLENSLSVLLSDSGSVEDFDCHVLYFYDEADLNGGYAFADLIDTPCTVTARLENYRGTGKLYLLDPVVMIDGEEAKKMQAAGQTEGSPTAAFYAELCDYVLSNCVNYTEWWSDAAFSVTDPTYYYLGQITEENYDEKMQKAKQLVDSVYRAGYWEIRERGRGTLRIGLCILPEDELYFCYQY